MNNAPIRPRLVASLLGLSLLLPAVNASDWPRWLGPNGDNIAPEAAGFDPDLSKWRVAWKAEVGKGYSTVTVAGNRAYTLGHDGQGKETVFCFNPASGAVLWEHSYDADLIARAHPGGPNASATVAGDRVFTLSKDGQVFCLDAAKGTVVWKAALAEVMGVKLPNWGFASTPVLHDGKLLLSGGKVAALDAQTGKAAWVSQEENHPGHATAVVFSRAGTDYVAALHGKGLSVLTAKDGKEVARHPFKANFDMTATTPVALAEGNRILISGNMTSELLGFDGQALASLWVSTEFKNAMNNSVRGDGVRYGIDGRQGSAAARFVCLGDDGKVVWAKEDFGYGTVIGIGAETLLALTENGELVTVKASRDGYQELSRLQVLGKTCWTSPVFADGRIFVRNDKGDLACLAKN